MIELLLIRHGETASNKERRLQGHLDIPLNETGLQQAQALGLALIKEHIDVIVCSDLQRAKQTADAIARHKNQPCQIDPVWRERCFGGFEGELISELEQRFPAEYKAWRGLDIHNQFPANAEGERCGESLAQFHNRIYDAFIQLCRQYSHKKVALVAHGGILECAYRIAHQLPLATPRQTRILNASINRFELSLGDNEFNLKLVEWGDTVHLGDSLDEISW